MAWIWLSAAIVLEVIATSNLKASDGFSRLWPSVVVVIGYVGSLALLGLTLKSFDVGLVYAVWSGVGTAAIVVVGIAVFGEPMTAVRLAGVGLIIAGVVLLNLSGTHS